MKNNGMFRLSGAVRKRGGKGLVTVAGFTMVLIAIGAYIYLVRARSTAPYFFEMGKEQLSQRQYSQAVDNLDKAHSIEPENKETARQLSRAYAGQAMDTVNLEERLAMLEKAAGLFSGQPEGHIRLKLSKTYLALAKENVDPEAQFDLLKKAGKYSAGSGVLDILAAMKSLADKTGDYEYALNVLSSMYDKNPSAEVKALLVKVLLSASDGAEDSGKKQVLVQRALQVDPDSELAREHMARLSASRKTIFGTVKSSFQPSPPPEKTAEAISESPEPDFRGGDPDPLESLEPVAAVEEEPVAGIEEEPVDVTTIEPFELPEIEPAPAVVESPTPAVEKTPAPVTMSLEEILDLKDVRKKTAWLEAYVEENADARACYHLAQIYTELRFETLKQVLAIEPDHKQAKQTLVEYYFQRGVKAKDPEEKMRAYRQVLDYDSGHVKALHNLGMLLQKQGSFDAAIARYEQAIESDQLFAPSYLTLGLLYWQKKADLKKAARCFEFYRELDPTSPTSKKVATYVAYLNKNLNR